jgi:hypothetical protein
MPRPEAFTIIVKSASGLYKLCKIIFADDGYYVTSPYHPAQKAVLFTATVNYSRTQQWIAWDDAIEIATLDEDPARLKLSHHHDGFVQFSGSGITSGRHHDGKPKGIGVRSWPLSQPTMGPAFGVTCRGIDSFRQVTKVEAFYDAVFEAADILDVGGSIGIEGFYFPTEARRFVRNLGGVSEVGILHPSGIVLQLRALVPAAGDFFGVHIFAAADDVDTPKPSFMLSGSTGNLRRNPDGDVMGDGVFCCYPRPQELPPARELEYLGRDKPVPSSDPRTRRV